MTGLIVDSTEHAALRESVGRIARRYGHAYFADRAREGGHVGELWDELGRGGFLGVHLPEEYGGGGGGLADYQVVLEELAAHGMPLLMGVISPAITGSIVWKHGSPGMKAEWLPGMADGSRKMVFALTEPDAGSNSHKVSTTAHPDGDGRRLTGTKYYISGVDEAEAVLVVARDGDPDPSGRTPLSLFVVPTNAPGVTRQAIPTELTVPEKQFTLFFDDVRVGPETIVGEAGRGLRQVFAGLNPERILAAALSNGIGRYALDKAAAYARERTVWNAPIGSHQGVSHPLAEAYVAVELARLAAARAAELYDSGQDAAETANIAKFAAADASLKALDQSIQTHGGNGLSREYGLADLWFVARLLRTAPVSREMVLNFIAQHSLRLPASY
ncbi:acyl-CoA dehydrogenase family protein [Streptomyces sp. NPDC004609]|uniref:acyl-CoA dehydrogenase family protein n=1 Tax=Streptomyces sp. NPDC004609 TaxID=3364704 RepID=UPI00367C64C4